MLVVRQHTVSLATDVTRSVVCVSVCLLVIWVCYTLLVMLFGRMTDVGQGTIYWGGVSR